MKLGIFLDRFSEHPHISNFMKIRQLGAELFHADGQTDMTTLRVAVRKFANVPKNHSDSTTSSAELSVTHVSYRAVIKLGSVAHITFIMQLSHFNFNYV